MMITYTGLAKTIYNSNVCAIASLNGKILDITIFSTERLTRKKYTGGWPFVPLTLLNESRHLGLEVISENRDVTSPRDHEEGMDTTFPFYDALGEKNLTKYSSIYNKEINFIGHHDAHAYCALAMSPFEKSIILIVDGAGSRKSDVIKGFPSPKNKKYLHESISVYTQNMEEVVCVKKEWQEFRPSSSCPTDFLSTGIGIFYESIAKFIFGSKMDSGKVMGLSAFGRPLRVDDRIFFLEGLDWSKAFKKSRGDRWDESPHMALYKDLAATAQHEYSLFMEKTLRAIKASFPEYDNLIFSGGCALNCSNNFKLKSLSLFKKIYVPPFPGDEGLSLGLSYFNYIKESKLNWNIRTTEEQHSFFGPTESVPSGSEVRERFKNFKITHHKDISKAAAEFLLKNNLIAWFQGKSECGPRSLGHRSILGSLNYPKLKKYLNKKIKFREEFRPYGGACLSDKIHLYFEVSKGFLNPFMSFSLPVLKNHSKDLKEITHEDNTSRVQTVHIESNKKFYNLIKYYGEQSGVYCILNTSLNIMGEPIVEDINDLYQFFINSEIKVLVIENYIIEKK